MPLDPGLSACVDAYATREEHKTMFGAGPSRSAAEVKSVLADLWTQLLALGAKVDWPTVYAKLWPIIAMLFSGKSVADVLAVILSWFSPVTMP